MQGEPVAAGSRARAIREKAIELGELCGIPDGTPWTIEIVFDRAGKPTIRRHQGPLNSDDDLLALARAVGLMRE